MAAALDVEVPATAAVAVADHLDVVEEHVEHMNFELENAAEMAAADHTAGVPAVEVAEADYRLEEHNLDDNSEEITQWEPEVGAAVAAACGAAAHATVAEDSH
jgi:tetrahydromethanopterin S-methyltransferase subunit G